MATFKTNNMWHSDLAGWIFSLSRTGVEAPTWALLPPRRNPDIRRIRLQEKCYQCTLQVENEFTYVRSTVCFCCWKVILIIRAALKQLLVTDGLMRINKPPPPLHRNPMVTGTSVLGVKFTGGVIIAADMLGSYGSLARFRNISRLMKVMVAANKTSAVDVNECHPFEQRWRAVSVSGEQQHHPGSFRGLRWLPASQTDHRTDGVSCWSNADRNATTPISGLTFCFPPVHGICRSLKVLKKHSIQFPQKRLISKS